MVNIALAGGSGNVAQEIIDVLLAANKHEIRILSRKDAPPDLTHGITWLKVDYADQQQLVHALQGVHTLLSFITDQDPKSPTQKRLIDAAVQAGVKRFAPSEWASSKLDHLSWYAYKGATRRYLEELNKDQKVLEYTLFQPGLLLNYLTYPHQSTTHMHPLQIPFDFDQRRAILLADSDDATINWVTIQDVARVVARAVDYEEEWPVVGGIRGAVVAMGRLVKMGEEIRGAPFAIERIRAEDLQAGKWTASWLPRLDHPSIPLEQVDAFSEVIASGLFLAVAAGAYVVSDEWNRRLPDFVITDAGAFLTEAWRGKP